MLTKSSPLAYFIICLSMTIFFLMGAILMQLPINQLGFGLLIGTLFFLVGLYIYLKGRKSKKKIKVNKNQKNYNLLIGSAAVFLGWIIRRYFDLSPSINGLLFGFLISFLFLCSLFILVWGVILKKPYFRSKKEAKIAMDSVPDSYRIRPWLAILGVLVLVFGVFYIVFIYKPESYRQNTGQILSLKDPNGSQVKIKIVEQNDRFLRGYLMQGNKRAAIFFYKKVNDEWVFMTSGVKIYPCGFWESQGMTHLDRRELGLLGTEKCDPEYIRSHR